MKIFYILILFTLSISGISLDSRIIGGDKVDNMIGRDFIVSLGTKSDGFYNHTCGATLIDELHVITAAHCVVDQDLYVFANYHLLPMAQVQGLGGKLGAMPTNNTKGKTVLVSRVFAHNKFKTDGVSDVAILKLSSPIKISKYAKLPSVGQTDPLLRKNQELELLGWGITSNSPEAMPSGNLKSIKLKTLTPEECIGSLVSDGTPPPQDDTLPPSSSNLPSSGASKTSGSGQSFLENFKKNTMCAGGEKVQQINEGSCKGDSGGPLVYRDGENITLMGIVSAGSTLLCGGTVAGYYTKVENFLDFISQAKSGSYVSEGRLRTGYIESLPTGFTLLGTQVTIDSTTKLFSSDIKFIMTYDSKAGLWSEFKITNGVPPSELYIAPKSGFWVYKEVK